MKTYNNWLDESYPNANKFGTSIERQFTVKITCPNLPEDQQNATLTKIGNVLDDIPLAEIIRQRAWEHGVSADIEIEVK